MHCPTDSSHLPQIRTHFSHFPPSHSSRDSNPGAQAWRDPLDSGDASHRAAQVDPYVSRHLCTSISSHVAPPFTAIIPNFPFFFCVWRAWSHYRAFKASKYLESFLSRGAIDPQPSAELDAIYAKYAPSPVTGSDGSTSKTGDVRFLLSRAAVPALQEHLGLAPGGTFAADLYRALEQARLRLEGGRT